MTELRTAARPLTGVRAAAPPLTEFHQRITAAFEANMLIRCARQGPSRRGPGRTAPPPRRPDGVFAEFSRADAADRLVTVLDQLGYPATRRDRTAGIRGRHPIYQIVLSPTARTEIGLVLHDGWRAGLAVLCDPPGGYLAPRRRQHRGELATAAWRAAVLAAGYRRRRGPRGFYIGDDETMAVLVRAGRVLNLTVTAQRRTGCHLVQVPESGPVSLAAPSTRGTAQGILKTPHVGGAGPASWRVLSTPPAVSSPSLETA